MLSLPSTPTQNPLLGHERPNIAISPCDTCTGVHAPDPPVGSDDTRTDDDKSPMTQNVVLGQATLSNWGSAVISGLTFVSVHAPAPPVGFVDVITFPSLSTATHRYAEGHEIAVVLLTVESTPALDQAPAPPVGSVDVRTSPPSSNATQSEGLGQETAVRPLALSVTTFQVSGPAAGSVEVRTTPAGYPAAVVLPTATQRCSSGQEIPLRLARPSIPLSVQAAAPPPGFVETMTFPPWSTATHSEGSAQETPVVGRS